MQGDAISAARAALVSMARESTAGARRRAARHAKSPRAIRDSRAAVAAPLPTIHLTGRDAQHVPPDRRHPHRGGRREGTQPRGSAAHRGRCAGRRGARRAHLPRAAGVGGGAASTTRASLGRRASTRPSPHDPRTASPHPGPSLNTAPRRSSMKELDQKDAPEVSGGAVAATATLHSHRPDVRPNRDTREPARSRAPSP